jgi:hypothetical protein
MRKKRTCVAQSDAAPGPVALEHLVEDDAKRVDVSFLRSASRRIWVAQQLWRSPQSLVNGVSLVRLLVACF